MCVCVSLCVSLCVCVYVCVCVFCIVMLVDIYIFFDNIFHLDVHYVCMLVQRFIIISIFLYLPVFGIFIVRAAVHACTCTLVLYEHRKRVCTES